MYKDSVTIIKPVANGPSARAGIKAGDRILYADKTKLLEESYLRIVCFLDSKEKKVQKYSYLSKIRNKN
jgi:C-terminal processing protease CtpA/Prc